MLTDEKDPIVVIDGQHAGRQVGEMDDAIDSRGAVGPGHLVVPDGDPGVLVADAPGVARPWAAGGGGLGVRGGVVVRGGLVVHRRIVARAGRLRPTAVTGS